MRAVNTDGSERPRQDTVLQSVRLPSSDATEPLEHPLVLVEWHDAWFDVDESGPEDRRTDYPVRTVGFLVGDGPSVLSLAQEVLPDAEGFRAVTHIPLPIVKRVVPLQASGP